MASPTVRKLARELGVEIDDIAGTGPDGRIDVEDVKSHVRALVERAAKRHEPEPTPLPDFAAFGEIEREPMSGLRRTIAENVTRGWREIPQVTQYDQADATALMAFLDSWKERANEDVHPSPTAVLVRACAEALRRFPAFNAAVDIEAQQLVFRRYIHIGVAVDTDAGLLVPVIHDADEKGLDAIAAELTDLAERARDRKLGREQLQGATFSITNLGGMGTTHFTPLLMPGLMAILSVGRMQAHLRPNGTTFTSRDELPLGVTYDHRGVDGADAARFLRFVCELLEQPLRGWR